MIDPNQFPSGTCRDVAIDWNEGVSEEEDWTWFEPLIDEAAAANCKFDFVRIGDPDQYGVYDLVSLRPAP